MFSATASFTPSRAQVIGLGAIGGSIALALRSKGWFVTGLDVDVDRMHEAKQSSIIDEVGIDAEALITFIATPVSEVAQTAEEALARGGVVTDVGSVKSSVTRAINHQRFVGGHPMAGTERAGLAGVSPNLFDGATWVLTPGPSTDPEVYVSVRNVVVSFGAEVMTLDPVQHDKIVATISHVPHLTAALLMNLALEGASEEPVLRLAATGFRDMTRIAAGLPELWADISIQNKTAIVDELGHLIAMMDELRELIANDDRGGLLKTLGEASHARRELPLRVGRPADLAQIAVVIPDAPGALGDVLGVFGRVRVNIEDFEISHAMEGRRGTLLLTVATDKTSIARSALEASGFRASVVAL